MAARKNLPSAGAGILLALTLLFFARFLFSFHPMLMFNLFFLVSALSIPFLAFLFYACLRDRLSWKLSAISRVVCAALAGLYGADLGYILWRSGGLHPGAGWPVAALALTAGLFLASLLCSRFLKPYDGYRWTGLQIFAFVVFAAVTWVFLSYLGEWYDFAQKYPEFVLFGIPALALYLFLCIRFPALGRVTFAMVNFCFVIVSALAVAITGIVGGIMKRP